MTTGQGFAIEQLSAVSNTALLTLWTRALDARTPDPILPDPQAVALCEQLRPYVAAQDTSFHQYLAADKIPQMLVKMLSVRSQYMDEKARDFLSRFGRGVVVNLGAGLDTRFARLGSGLDGNGETAGRSVRVIDVDLPAMVALKRQLLVPHPRHELIEASVLELAWMDALDRYDDRRFFFIAEGLLPYLEPQAVRRLLVAMADRFPGSELVADVFSASLLRPPWHKWTMRKMRQQFHFDRNVVMYFGLDSPQEMESWDPRLHFVSMWSLFDSTEGKMGRLRWLRHIRLIRMMQFIVHYRLG